MLTSVRISFSPSKGAIHINGTTGNLYGLRLNHFQNHSQPMNNSCFLQPKEEKELIKKKAYQHGLEYIVENQGAQKEEVFDEVNEFMEALMLK